MVLCESMQSQLALLGLREGDKVVARQGALTAATLLPNTLRRFINTTTQPPARIATEGPASKFTGQIGSK